MSLEFTIFEGKARQAIKFYLKELKPDIICFKDPRGVRGV